MIFFYFLFADGFRGGQSLGKRWIGMYVIDEKSGEPCTFGDKAAGTIVVLD